MFDVVLDDGQVVSQAAPGDLVGETALFLADHRRTATLRATEPSRVLVINTRPLFEIDEKSSEVG